MKYRNYTSIELWVVYIKIKRIDKKQIKVII